MTTNGVAVREAAVADLNRLVPLFDAYRQFYRQPSEPERARRFLLERLEYNQSVIFLAFADAAAIGFTAQCGRRNCAPRLVLSFSASTNWRFESPLAGGEGRLGHPAV